MLITIGPEPRSRSPGIGDHDRPESPVIAECFRSTLQSALDPFQILSRRPIRHKIPQDGIEDFDLTASVTLARDPDDKLDHAIDDNERGLKDTIRVNPNEIVEIAVRFTTYAGRYMYHCHILEHEAAT